VGWSGVDQRRVGCGAGGRFSPASTHCSRTSELELPSQRRSNGTVARCGQGLCHRFPGGMSNPGTCVRLSEWQLEFGFRVCGWGSRDQQNESLSCGDVCRFSRFVSTKECLAQDSKNHRCTHVLIYMKVKTHSQILYTFNAAFPAVSTLLLAEVAKPMAVSQNTHLRIH
jgi:hypothetical protein